MKLLKAVHPRETLCKAVIVRISTNNDKILGIMLMAQLNLIHSVTISALDTKDYHSKI